MECSACVNELDCEYGRDNTSCQFSPIGKICMECKDMFDANSSDDKFCCVRCETEFKARFKFDKNQLEMRIKFGKYTRSDNDRLDYLNTLEGELFGN